MARASLFRPAATIALIILASLLAVLMSSRKLATYWAHYHPQWSLRLDPGDPDALIRSAKLAERKQDFKQAAAYARRSLQHDPMHYGTSMRIIGEEAASRNDGDPANKLLDATETAGWRDPSADRACRGRANHRHQYRAALQYADAMLRQEPDYQQSIIPSYLDRLQRPEVISAIVLKLASAPPWRGAFLAQVEQGGHDPQLIAILRAMGRTRRPLTSEELGPALTALASRGQYQTAFELWRALAPDAKLFRDSLVDGDFREATGTLPFAWRVASGAGYSAEVQSVDVGQGGALKADYDGFSTGQLAQQLIMLSPGEHAFSADAAVKSGDGSHLSWVITCGEGGDPLMTVPSATDRPADWVPIGGRVTVPATGCGAQWLTLVGNPGERRSDIEVWYRRLRFEDVKP